MSGVFDLGEALTLLVDIECEECERVRAEMVAASQRFSDHVMGDHADLIPLFMARIPATRTVVAERMADAVNSDLDGTSSGRLVSD